MAPAFDPDELGERMASLEMEHEEAVEHVREALRDEGFGLPVEFSVSDLLREKVNSDLGPYYVLGGCNPGIADRALATTKRIGGLFPCNFAVWEEEPGVQVVYHVSIMKLAEVVGMGEGEAWSEIVEETGKAVERVWSRL